MANQYENPDAEHVHITHINDTKTGLTAGLDNCQIAIETDFEYEGETVPVLAFRDHEGVYREVTVFDNLAHKIEDHLNYVEHDCGSGGFMIYDVNESVWTNWRPYQNYPNGSSGTLVESFNADLLDGLHSSAFPLASNVFGYLTHSYLPKYNVNNRFENSNIYNSNSRVGILTNDPQYPLDVTGDIRSSSALRVGNSTLGVVSIIPYLFNNSLKSFRMYIDSYYGIDMTLNPDNTIDMYMRGDIYGGSSYYKFWHAGNLTGNQTGHYHDSRYYTETETDAKFLQLSGGSVTGNVNLGATSTPTVTDTPTNLRFDNGYSATAGKTKSKLFLYRDASEIIHGFGVSAGATDYYSASYHDFHLGDTRTLRIQADSVIFGASSVVWHSGNLTGDQTGHNHDGRHLKLSGGTLTGPLAVGNLTTPTATDTPTTVTFDRTYSTTPGKTKCKLFLYRDVDNNIHGLGVSAASTDYHSVAYHKFYAGDNIILQAQPGVVSIGNTAADPASTATPTKLLLDRTYSNGSTKDKCKIVMLEGTDGSIYGFSCGANYDNQYHSQRQHDFYGDNNLEVRINREGISIPSITSSGSGSAVRIDSNGLLTKDTSSIRYKENVVSNINTEWLYDIQVCQYDRKDGSTKGEVGIIAEELALIKPELVTFDKDGRIDGYNKIDLIPVLINEVQRLRKEIEILKDRI